MQDVSQPQCDVVIPYHDAAYPYVAQAIDSILVQNDVECIVHVIADNVPEMTEHTLRTMYADMPRVRFYRNDETVGPYRSLHRIFPQLQTQYIAIQDSDDIALPHRIAHSLSLLQQQSADIVGHAMRNFVDEDSQSDATLQAHVRREPVSYSGVQTEAYPNGRVINGTMLMTKDVFVTMNGFADWYCGGDAEFIERARKAGKRIAIDDDVVLLRRLHTKSLSTNGKTGMGSPYRTNILKEMHQRFESFTPGFDPAQYGTLFPKVSACLLSWKRPQNMQRIVDHLRTVSCIDEIIIWNNNQEIDLQEWVTGDDVRIINHPENIGTYGRFLCATHAKNDVIYTQDDDCISDDIDKIIATFLNDSSRIAHGYKDAHFKRREEYIYGSAQMAFMAWGGLYKKEWIAVLDTYLKHHPKDTMFYNCADRIFSILQNTHHSTVHVDATDLPGHSGKEAMWVRKEHWEEGAEAERRALRILGLPSEQLIPRSGSAVQPTSCVVFASKGMDEAVCLRMNTGNLPTTVVYLGANVDDHSTILQDPLIHKVLVLPNQSDEEINARYAWARRIMHTAAQQCSEMYYDDASSAAMAVTESFQREPGPVGKS